MKFSRAFFIVLALVMVAINAQAARYGRAGCGLGSLIVEQNGQWQQVLAATLNGTSGTQTFGISSGTSNCENPTSNKKAQIDAFVEANQIALNNDIAKGQGETIVGLSQVYGCKDSQKLGQTLQQNYRSIFPSNETEVEFVTQAIEGLVKNNLQGTCTAAL